jgi:excisionase family DNA binding protein
MDAAAHTGIIDRIAPSGLMTTEQAAAYLGIKPNTLVTWRSTNRQKLVYAKVGGQVRYRRQDLDAFITENLRNAEPA